MRPDPRLLLEVSALPFVPEGARRVRADDPTWGCAHRTTDQITGLGAAQWMLDCSAPTKRAGLDERLDVLPWLLTVLHEDASGCEFDEDGDLWVYHGPGIGCALVVRPERDAKVCGGIVVDPWPDLSGLTPDEAARAVVVAAIRQRGQVSP